MGIGFLIGLGLGFVAGGVPVDMERAAAGNGTAAGLPRLPIDNSALRSPSFP